MPEFLWDLIDISATVILVLLFRRFVLMLVRVKGNSMNNTLKNGQFMLCWRLFYRKNMKRGDIVICHYPGRTHQFLHLFKVRTCFVKRLIALPGDVIETRDGVFYVNGNPEILPRSSASHPAYQSVFRRRTVPFSPIPAEPPEELKTEEMAFRRIGSMEVYTRYKLHENECFVMGDHRAVSHDCRRIGPIDTGMILGKVCCVFFPFRTAKKL